MRKELPGSYTVLDKGLGVRARLPNEKILEYEIPEKDLVFDVSYTDRQGGARVGRIVLRPVVSEVTRVDKLLRGNWRLHYLAARVCYSPEDRHELLHSAQTVSEEKASGLIEDVVRAGHLSVIEHSSPAFLVDGSRVWSHQEVRHRHCSFSQRSQRYLDYAAQGFFQGGEAIFPVVVPPSIRANPEAMTLFLKSIRSSVEAYCCLRGMGVKPEDARFLFQNSVATMMVLSGNWRVWFELAPKRTCARAQWEIDMVITEIMRQLFEENPAHYRQVGPACSTGQCDQGKRSCGVALNRPLSAFFDNDEYPHDRLVFGMR